MVRIRLISILIVLLTLLAAGAPPNGAPPLADSSLATALEAAAATSESQGDKPNIILFIGDGMGREHVRAAGMYLGRSLVFESFTHTGSMTTHSMEGVTDSAAAGTAMATGRRVNNEVISVAIPGNGEELTTVLEMWQAQGRSTGLATTSIINDATPASFAAHQRSRNHKAEIALDYFQESRPNVLLGGAGPGVTQALALAGGYAIVENAAQLLALDTGATTHVAGLFGNDVLRPINHGREPMPTLAQMTRTALDVLDDDPDGFFLMVEQEGADSYSHGNNLELMVDAVIELEAAVEAALAWAEKHDDTLIIVTADHETGGLMIRQDNGPGELPDVSWTAGSRHTDLPVPIYARGPGAQMVTLVDDITELHMVTGPGEALFEHEVLLPMLGWFRGR